MTANPTTCLLALSALIFSAERNRRLNAKNREPEEFYAEREHAIKHAFKTGGVYLPLATRHRE